MKSEANKPSKLDEILLKHRSDAFLISRGESKGLDIGTSAAQAHAEILALIEEVIIGEDEDARIMPDGTPITMPDLQRPKIAARNKLRAEQRLRKDAL